jgi:hypothetical protein
LFPNRLAKAANGHSLCLKGLGSDARLLGTDLWSDVMVANMTMEPVQSPEGTFVPAVWTKAST